MIHLIIRSLFERTGLTQLLFHSTHHNDVDIEYHQALMLSIQQVLFKPLFEKVYTSSNTISKTD